MANLGKLSQVLGGAATAGGAVAAGTAGVLDQNKEEEWVGRLRDFLHPPSVPMGSIASQEIERRFAPQGGEISQGDAFWMGGGRPLPQRSEADAYRMGGMARMDQYKPNTFREIDRQDIEDRYGGADLHGIKLPPVSRDEPRAWFDAVVPQSPLDVGLMAAGPAGRLAGKGAAALTGAAGVMGELVDPAEAGGMGKLLRGKPGGPWEGGIRAYHSSPHDFDRFDWSKLRTGEGANTFGAGFYAAENPAVSGQGGQYWSQFLHKFPKEEMRSAEWLRQHGFDREAATVELQRQIGDLQSKVKGIGSASAEDMGLKFPTAEDQRVYRDNLRHYYNDEIGKYQERLGHLQSNAPVGPRTYEVNINARPELLLDWDKPLKQQPPAVYETLRTLGVPDKPHVTGSMAYWDLGGQALTRGAPSRDVPEFASKTLAEAGIPGIRYLDQGSRPMPAPELANLQWRLKQAEEAQQKYPQMSWANDDVARYQKQIAEEQARAANPSYNYVVTDPSKLDILAKYGVVGTAGGLGALAAQDQYQR